MFQNYTLVFLWVVKVLSPTKTPVLFFQFTVRELQTINTHYYPLLITYKRDNYQVYKKR